MAKTSFSQWDTTANNNTDVGGVNINEGCGPSGINNGMREMMAQLKAGVDGKLAIVNQAISYTAVATDNNAWHRATAAITTSLTAAATLGANWHLFVQAAGGDVVIDPNASELINGAATVTIPNGGSAWLGCTGSAFYAAINPALSLPYAEKSGNYTAVAGDNNGIIRYTAAATHSLTAAATLGSAWRQKVINSSTGLVIIDPNASQTINGATILLLPAGQTVEIICNGTAFFADIHGDTFSGPQNQGYKIGLALSTNGTDASNDVDIAVGSATADVSPYYLMQLTGARTKRIDAAWAVGTNAGGLDTGAVADNTYYIWLIQRPDTGVTDPLFSLSSTAPVMPANYTLKRRIGSLVRAGGVNGVPTAEFPFGLVLGSLASLDITDLVYAGTSASNTNFPVTTTLAVISSAVNRCATSPVYIFTGGTIDYTISAGGTQLAGTWNARGLADASRQNFQRTA